MEKVISWAKHLLLFRKNMKKKYLNLGCGGRYHHEWTNVDFYETGPGVIAHNLTKRLPFSDNSYDVVYHSHVLEHFSKRGAPVFLKECMRVLKPGGIIRVVVPDLEQIAKLYLSVLELAKRGDALAAQKHEWILIELFDQMVRNVPGGEMLNYWKQNPMPAEEFVIERVGSEVLNVLSILRNPNNPLTDHVNITNTETRDPLEVGKFRLSGEVHQWVYDEFSLSRLLRDIGFHDIRRCSADESEIEYFNLFLLDIEADGSIRKPESLFLEARKPSS